MILYFINRAKNANLLINVIVIVFIILSLHVFIIPSDILTKFPLFKTYTDFMISNFSVMKQIAVRTTDIPQIGLFYSSNMILLSFVLFILSIYFSFFDYIKRYNGFGWFDYKVKKITTPSPNDIFKVVFLIFIVYLFTLLAINKIFDGSLFDTMLRGEDNINFINSKLGLFYKVSLFFFSLALLIGCIISMIIHLIVAICVKFIIVLGNDNEQ